MERTLQQLGLNKKESSFYLSLLNSKGASPQELARQTGETRVNAYAILDNLVNIGLVTRKEIDKKFLYQAENPTKLKELANQKQSEAAQVQKELTAIMPNMLANFRISQNKPGVLHLEGVGNLKIVYDDILRAKKDLSIFPSKEKRKIAGLNEFVEERIKMQKKAGIKTRALYHEHTRKLINTRALYKKDVEVKFWNASPYEAQIIIYGDNVVINTFTDTVFTTVITDPVIASTMRVIFDEAWRNAKY